MYCIQIIHRRIGNKYALVGLKHVDGRIKPDNAFYSSLGYMRGDFKVYSSIADACADIRLLDLSVWRPIIRGYPMTFGRWNSDKLKHKNI